MVVTRAVAAISLSRPKLSFYVLGGYLLILL